MRFLIWSYLLLSSGNLPVRFQACDLIWIPWGNSRWDDEWILNPNFTLSCYYVFLSLSVFISLSSLWSYDVGLFLFGQLLFWIPELCFSWKPTAISGRSIFNYQSVYLCLYLCLGVCMCSLGECSGQTWTLLCRGGFRPSEFTVHLFSSPSSPPITCGLETGLVWVNPSLPGRFQTYPCLLQWAVVLSSVWVAEGADS